MEPEIEEALELAAGSRLKTGGFIDRRANVNRHDTEITRKTILLFLESLDPELTVSELREHLDA